MDFHSNHHKNEQYFSFSYEQIERILFSILTLSKEQLNPNAFTFIEDYYNVLNEKYNPNQDQVLLAIDLYQNYGETIDSLFEELSQLYKPLHFEAGYNYEFKTKYKETITYIYNHGQNILRYSFERFIEQQFNDSITLNNHPTVPSLLPPE